MEYIKQIEAYNAIGVQDKNDKKVMLEFINESPKNLLTRENEIAHFTSSGFVINRTCTKVLMIHHNIYNTWTWTGGHADGEADLLLTAIKEAKEETGLENIEALSDHIDSLDVLPVWGHEKKGKYISAHLHLNASFVLVADEQHDLSLNEEETSGVKWISIDEIEEASQEPFLLEIYFRLIEIAKKQLL